MVFRGHFDYSLDAKNRLNLPPKWRGELSEGVVLVQGVDACIEIYTPDAFQAKVEGALEGKNPMSKEYREITRYYAGNAFDETLDTSGRVIVKAQLLDHAGIKKAVVVAGAMNYAEVWDADRWKAEQSRLGASIEGVAEGLGHPS